MNYNTPREAAPTAETEYNVAMAKTDILGFPDIAELLGIGVTSARTYHSRAEYHRKQAAATGDKSLIRPGDLPEPDGKFGNSPYWEKRTIDRWLRQRPGQGGHNKSVHKLRKTG